jgi:hypothetical protein
MGHLKFSKSYVTDIQRINRGGGAKKMGAPKNEGKSTEVYENKGQEKPTFVVSTEVTQNKHLMVFLKRSC